MESHEFPFWRETSESLTPEKQEAYDSCVNYDVLSLSLFPPFCVSGTPDPRSLDLSAYNLGDRLNAGVSDSSSSPFLSPASPGVKTCG